MSSVVIFDTSVFVDHFRTGCHQKRMDSVSGLIRNSSVVLAELWRGARTRGERESLLELERNHPILIPTGKNWIESGRVLGEIQRNTGFSSSKLRNLHFDLLIALTARSAGGRLITSNKIDFELIQSYRWFQLEIWPTA